MELNEHLKGLAKLNSFPMQIIFRGDLAPIKLNQGTTEDIFHRVGVFYREKLADDAVTLQGVIDLSDRTSLYHARHLTFFSSAMHTLSIEHGNDIAVKMSTQGLVAAFQEYTDSREGNRVSSGFLVLSHTLYVCEGALYGVGARSRLELVDRDQIDEPADYLNLSRVQGRKVLYQNVTEF